MDEIGSYEAKTKLAKLLREVEEGKQFTITRHGTPVARLVSAKNGPDQTTGEVIDELKKFRRSNELGEDITVRQLKETGRR